MRRQFKKKKGKILKCPKYGKLFSRCECDHAMISNDVVNVCDCKTVQSWSSQSIFLSCFYKHPCSECNEDKLTMLAECLCHGI